MQRALLSAHRYSFLSFNRFTQINAVEMKQSERQTGSNAVSLLELVWQLSQSNSRCGSNRNR